MGPFNLNVFLILAIQILAGGFASLIKLENGQYNGAIIGIDGAKVSSTQCKTILENLDVLLPLFSEKLFEATEQKASIGEVNVLLPDNWVDADCNLTAADIHDAKPNESFRNSNFQITQNHSLAEILPWTRQYRPCGQPGDSIVIPISFLENPNITDSIKAQLLLHEWAKFRYGVFDEFGYAQDKHKTFSPCYTYGNQAYFTSCSSPGLPAVVQNASVCNLEFLSKYSSDLIRKLGDGPTSVMSFPYLQNFTKFCNADTHNRWAPTKQNFYCNRKSVGEVVLSHSDFVQQKQRHIVQNNQDPSLLQPKLRYFRHRHSSEYNPAYVIVIEDSQDMRDQYKIFHVKQAMAQFLEILEVNTKIHLLIFEGVIINHYSKTLKGDEDKVGLLKEIPDVSSIEDPGTPHQNQRNISHVIDKLLEIFNDEQTNSWHVLLFADSSPVTDPITADFSGDIAKFGSTSHTISIFTFENNTESNSQEWLQWYSIPNTRNVVALPLCTLSSMPWGPCSFQTSSFILDQIVGNLNDQQFNLNRPRFIQTWGQVSIPNVKGQDRIFNLEGDSKLVKRLYLFMTLPEIVDDPSNYIEVLGIDGLCETTNLLSYGHVIKFTGNGCTYKSGQWMVKVREQVPPWSRPLLLNIFAEMDADSMTDRLIVTPSLSTVRPNIQELLPNQNIYPVYVSVQTQRGNPVLNAQVTLHIFHPNLFNGNAQDKTNGSVIVLRDDGSSNGPDQTGNDGIYSGYLSGFSSVSKTFHLVQVQVTTTSETLIMNSSLPSRAVLLNDKLTNKCCGKMIHELGYSSFQPPNLKFQMLHFGFKTKDAWSQKLFFPPGSIETISVLENNERRVVMGFDAVAGDNTGNETVTVQNYQACCVPSNSTESMQTTPYPTELSCKDNSVECDDIRPPNERQICSMNKDNLVKLWVPVHDQKLVHSLMCALRAINSNGEFGSLSQEFKEVTVTQAIDKLMSEEKPKCENLFDDKCLPFWVFWVLIGCLAGVLLVLLVVLCCWCCALRKKRKETTSTVESGKHPPKPTKENVLAVHYSPHPQQQRQFKNHTNQSSAEDVNAEDESKVVKEIFVNHAYIQDGDGEIKIIADNGQILRKPKNDSAPLPPIEENPNMQIFKPVPMPISKPSRMPRTSDHARSRARRHNDRPQIVHSNPMLRSDSSYNSLERQSLAQQQQQQPPPSQFIPSSRNTDPALVYATISRTGRLNNQQHVSSPKQLTFDPHYMVPHNSVPFPPQPTSRQLARDTTLSRSPPKVPNYPPPIYDSETSTDFDIRRRGGARRLPPQFNTPPPYPEGSQLVITAQQTPASNDSIFRRGIPVQSRPVNPPVPPPRFDRQTSSVNARNRNNGSIKTFCSKQEMVLSDEDDSDEWDDGDNYEFQNTTGVSYA